MTGPSSNDGRSTPFVGDGRVLGGPDAPQTRDISVSAVAARSIQATELPAESAIRAQCIVTVLTSLAIVAAIALVAFL